MYTDTDYLKRAVELAIEHSSSGVNGPFGAVIVKDDEIVGEGWNQVVESHDPSAHAEIVAIRDACERLHTHVLDGCTLYASCEPCPMCLSAIYWARIARVVFAATGKMAADAGFDDLWILDELGKHHEERKITIENINPELGRRAFDAWENNDRKMMY